uniref:CCHC-type domain-containing protein n=1 Tax=Ananas comosus var. bracteatus TaxID=296719 RepID=A0A6V7NU30_ANACO|nr:unnamed protein product [Ananas comosus var. bracteatus]
MEKGKEKGKDKGKGESKSKEIVREKYTRVRWADTVGRALTRTAHFNPQETTPNSRLIDTSKPESWRSDRRQEKFTHSVDSGLKKTYKEALLTPTSLPPRQHSRSHIFNTFHHSTYPSSVSFSGKCYRCLDTSHRAAKCRAPIRCVSVARRAILHDIVWIACLWKLLVLPYGAALVGGFGRFIRADDFSVRMVDFTGYRCLISVNHLSDIPENLEIVVGDSSLSVLIQLERWGRRDVAAPGIPPNERTDQHDPQHRPIDVQRRSAGLSGGDGRRPEDLRALTRHGIRRKSGIEKGPYGDFKFISSEGSGPSGFLGGLLLSSRTPGAHYPCGPTVRGEAPGIDATHVVTSSSTHLRLEPTLLSTNPPALTSAGPMVGGDRVGPLATFPDNAIATETSRILPSGSDLVEVLVPL